MTTEPDFGTGEKKLSIYIIGTILCVALTLIPFAAVMRPEVSDAATLGVIFVSAIAQFITQVVCFLRLNYSTPQSRMNVMSFIFSIVVLLVVVVGSIWIMWNLNYHMMR